MKISDSDQVTHGVPTYKEMLMHLALGPIALEVAYI